MFSSFVNYNPWSSVPLNRSYIVQTDLGFSTKALGPRPLMVAPNPFSERVTIFFRVQGHSGNPVTLRLIDVAGRI